jgi:hypothetical protein
MYCEVVARLGGGVGLACNIRRIVSVKKQEGTMGVRVSFTHLGFPRAKRTKLTHATVENR